MVRSDRFAKFSNVGAHSDVVLPDLPVLKVTPEGFPERMKGLFSARNQQKNILVVHISQAARERFYQNREAEKF